MNSKAGGWENEKWSIAAVVRYRLWSAPSLSNCFSPAALYTGLAWSASLSNSTFGRSYYSSSVCLLFGPAWTLSDTAINQLHLTPSAMSNMEVAGTMATCAHPGCFIWHNHISIHEPHWKWAGSRNLKE